MVDKVAFGKEKSGWLMRMLGQQTRRPEVPQGRRVFAIGDIHGRRDLLEQLLEKINAGGADIAVKDRYVFLGDYIDRGPDSKGVIELLLALPSEWQKVFLMGNHDKSLLEFLRDPLHYRAWRNYGAPETLLSYGVRPPRFDDDEAFAAAQEEFAQKLPPTHLAFLKNLQLMHEEGDYLFVHAGIRPGIALHQQREGDLLWIRDDFLLSNELGEKVVVHGHTPSDRVVWRANRLGLDTGAHASGRLTAAILQGDKVSFVETTPQIQMKPNTKSAEKDLVR